MVKINLGCGTNRLPGWQNHDMDVDIREALPFPTDHADFIFAEHVVEHVTPREAYRFFEQCHRVLKSGGVLRVAVPSVVQIANSATPDYRRFLQEHGWGDNAVRAIIFEHGHQAIWSVETLLVVLRAVGFDATHVKLYKSEYEELQGIEGHASIIGQKFNELETICAEAKKL